MFQAKTRDRLQKGRFFYREEDQRQNIEFEPRIGFDPFVSYLGYIRDISLKSYEVVEHKILELKVWLFAI